MIDRRFAPPEHAPALVVTPDGDAQEREADQVADRLAGSLSAAAAGTGDGDTPPTPVRPVRLMPPAGPRPVQRSPNPGGDTGGALGPQVAQAINVARGRGRPLPTTVRQPAEQTLGQDLGKVRVHADHRADQLNRLLQARAFTSGHDIYFRKGGYAPGTFDGAHTLAHELTHVAQQSGDLGVVQLARTRSKTQKAKAMELGVEELVALEEQTDRFDNTLRDRDAMTAYLLGSGLATGEPPKPVSIGAVVWNVNHLSGEGDEEEDLGLEEEAREDGEEETAPGLPDVDVGQLVTGLGLLGSALGAITDELAAVVRRQSTARKRKSEDTEADSVVSQFSTDVNVLVDLDLAATGVMLTRGLQSDGPSSTTMSSETTIDAEADELHRLRRVYRLWKRLDRVQRLLAGRLPASVKRPVKAALQSMASTRVGTADEELDEQVGKNLDENLDEKVGKVVGTVIDELFERLPLAAVANAVGHRKKALVERLTTTDFFRNEGVDLVLLNELNQVGDWLAKIKGQGHVGVSEGPEMLALGTKKVTLPKVTKRGKGRKKATGDDPGSAEAPTVTYSGRQHEYYSAFYRTGGEHPVSANGTFYVTTAGKFIVQDDEGEHGHKIPWNKYAHSFRGIVVHRLSKDGQELWAGVVHTTPAGQGLHREKIWPQLENGLAELGKLAEHFQVPLLVGGDFYISAEALVQSPSPRDLRDVEEDDPGHVQRQIAEHLLRSMFLAAFSRGETNRLLAQANEQPSAPEEKAKPEEGRPLRDRRSTVIWQRYKVKAKRKVDRLVEENASPEAMHEELAPRTTGADEPDPAYEGVAWTDTRSAGTIQKSDLTRNSRLVALTLARVVAPLGYRVVDSGTSTNPKEHGRREDKEQLADLFLVNKHWQTTASGIVTPGSWKLLPADDSERSATHTYLKVSDHSPPAMVASTTADDLDLFQRFDLPPTAASQARDLTVASWELLAERLKRVEASASPTVDFSGYIQLVRSLVAQPWTRTAPDRSKALSGATAALAEKVVEVEGIDASVALAADIRGWTPYLAKDIPPDSTQPWSLPGVTTRMSDDPGGDHLESKGPEDDGPHDEGPGSNRPGDKGVGGWGLGGWGLGSGLGNLGAKIKDLGGWLLRRWGLGGKGSRSQDLGGKAEEVSRPVPTAPGPGPSTLPTGEIEHFALNSCYVAALLFLLASNDELRKALSPTSVEGRKAVDQRRIVALRDISSLPKLVDALRRPGTVIDQGAIAGLMGQLVVQGFLSSRRAFGSQQDVAEVLQNILGLLEPGPSLQHGTRDRIDNLAGEPIRYIPDQAVAAVEQREQRENTLQLEINDPDITSIETALQKKAATEELTLNDGGNVRKTTELTRLPTVLIVVLKRFRSGVGQASEKVKKRVAAPDRLQIPDSCLAPGLKDKPFVYDLRHVVHHEGEFGGGHYTSYGRLDNGRWFHHNDLPGHGRRLTVLGTDVRPDAIDTGYVYVYVRQGPPPIDQNDAMEIEQGKA